MLTYVNHEGLGQQSYSWLNSIHHFPYGSYSQNRNRFGALFILNDDTVDVGGGWPLHPHENMEIITYVIEGEITHKDSLGNGSTLKRGEVQYMSSGTGIRHSEHNHGDGRLRFYQIWIRPHARGVKPNYGDLRLPWEDRIDKWMPIASENKGFPIRIYADLNLYACYLQSGKEVEFKVGKGRQAYLGLMEGEAVVNGISLHGRDALEIIEEDVAIRASENAHMLMFEMKK